MGCDYLSLLGHVCTLVYTATVALLSLRSFVSAAPLVPRARQGAWNLPITAPQAGDVWAVGSSQNLTWDTSKIPHSAEDNTGILLLGYYDESEGENLDIGKPEYLTLRSFKAFF